MNNKRKLELYNRIYLFRKWLIDFDTFNIKHPELKPREAYLINMMNHDIDLYYLTQCFRTIRFGKFSYDYEGKLTNYIPVFISKLELHRFMNSTLNGYDYAIL